MLHLACPAPPPGAPSWLPGTVKEAASMQTPQDRLADLSSSITGMEQERNQDVAYHQAAQRLGME